MSAAFTGADLVYHHERYSDKIKNHFVSIEGQRRLNIKPELAHTRVAVTGFEHTVLLVGEVNTQDQKQIAENTMRTLPGVNTIINEIHIGPKLSHGQMLADSWITTKVKTRLLFSAHFDPDEVNVTTENATVFLMGELPEKQAKEAINIARYTKGVKKVVNAVTFLVPKDNHA